MRLHLLVATVWMALSAPLGAIEIRWPDADIPVPPLVQSYIVSECHTYKGFSEESVHDCIQGERYGYRAVVMMLNDPEMGEAFAERYRGCAAGLGDLGGRFHRRKAECMSAVYCQLWRFEFSRRASSDGHPVIREARLQSGQ